MAKQNEQVLLPRQNRLKEKYKEEVKDKLMDEFKYKNIMSVPCLEKIVISMGVGEAKDNSGILDKIKSYLGQVAGQLPVITKAKKSISSFKVTKGQPIGLMVTLRGEKMYSFLDKLINIVLPKVRDFRGISESSFDSRGNLNIGMREQVIFPEIDYKLIDRNRGLAITIVASAGSKEEGKRLLELLGMPFRS